MTIQDDQGTVNVKIPVTLWINQKAIQLEIDPRWTMLYVLREVLDLTGTKCGCQTGDCGACKIIADGIAVNACTLLARKAHERQMKIETIENLADGEGLHPIQEAFIECGAVQCGYCIPGMIIVAKALLDRNPDPDESEIRKALSNNICRCTGYVKIVQAIQLSAKRLKESREHAKSESV